MKSWKTMVIEQRLTTLTQIVEQFTNTLLFNIFHILAPLSPSKRIFFFFSIHPPKELDTSLIHF
jgi:hypothetical protein